MIEKIDIIGLGALGTMYADFFTRSIGKENVRVLAGRERIERYRKDGVMFNGKKCDLNFRVSEEESEPSQLMVYAVKYGNLKTAIEENAHLVGDDTLIISVLNGIVSEDDLGQRFGYDRIIYCTAQKMAAGKYGNSAECDFMGEWALGVREKTDIRMANLKKVCDFLDRAGFPYVLPDDIMRGMWEKLMCNVGVNQAVTYFEGTYATIQAEGKPREMMQEAMRETVRVANAEGIDLSEKDVLKWTAVVDGLNPDGEPSMRQDAKSGRKTEKALFSGTIRTLGDRHGIDTPVNDLFFESID